MIKPFTLSPVSGQKLCVILFLILGFIEAARAQMTSQTLRGRLMDAITNQPLVGANILLDDASGTTSDSSGQFRFEGVPSGRHDLRFTFIGYDTLRASDVIVRSGQESYLNFLLDPVTTTMALITITGKAGGISTMTPSQEIITRESVLRYPATYFDPARLATAYAGVSGLNDQANGMSVRGHSPNALGWRLQGVEIVNPNHTPNAGTPGDRTTANGGGVNMISAQLFSDTRFFRGLLPGRYGNATSGLIDMYLREGNDQRWRYTAQIGLIGIDAAAEGPISRNSGASVLANYRYSTVGLLSAMGLDLGDEEINFQDLAINLNLPLKKNGSLSVFAIGGTSENIFMSDPDTTIWEENKDQFDIDFEHTIGILGARLTIPLSQNGSWHTAAAISGMDGSRFARPSESGNAISDRTERDEYWQTKASIQSYLQLALAQRQSLTLGVSLLQQQDFLRATINAQALVNDRMDRLLVQPYAIWRTRLSDKWQAEASIRGFFLSDAESRFEPRATLSWQASPNSQIQLAYGWQHQRQPVQVELAANNRFDAYRVAQSSISWTHKFHTTTRLTVAGYYQQLIDLAVSAEVSDAFNAINLLENYQLGALSTTGEGKNLGFEVTLEKTPKDGWYYLLTASIYEATYQGSDGIWRDSRWNGQYTANGILGREWVLAPKKEKDRLLGANIRMSAMGGFRTSPIDEEASELAQTTIFDTENAFSEQLGAFSRIDLRIFFRKDHPKRTTTLALDIQNLTNAENEAFRYYDPLTQEIVVKNQLGIIPLLSYRIQF